MKIIIIEDDDYKYNIMFDALNILLEVPIIIRKKSRNSGLRIIKESYQNNDYFDLIICDNYMPLFDDGNIVQPYAYGIINYIRRFISKDVPICVYSSEKIDSCNYDYFIKYDRSLSLNIIQNELKQILEIIEGKKSKKLLEKSNDLSKQR